MKKIEKTFMCVAYDEYEFHTGLQSSIMDLQEGGLEVEIQYQTNTINYAEVRYSALIIGRKEE